ncbi:amino acid ABC transporter permease [Sphingopyxis sp. RIFCSPHIGHO2_12_FULL_65_19]|uniref:amino acid ABC transporter permease n=1 Tax=Sphingopyxis sp. RIFCSPHIGHO2_12_FULL_65_19 TaxID=1802172 RepID=UPI0008C72668|nr:amino acid ABC transporter permease [Sphingopyxis sp. RIFCSPHIGHO2_12_FULL_65_19]OHD06771.1 MAG: amino acid ABC transporter permease [Sphingopyxis sp. RIFCSPHIGHO2_12_FULL_65_19]
MQEFLADAALFLPVLLRGLGMTLLLTAAALAVSIALGLLWVLMGYARFAPLRWISRAIINVIRGIPIIVQLFCIYFVLPEWGLDLPPFAAGVLGLGLAYSVYQAENFRGGLSSVDKDLIEAGTMLGMTWPVLMRRVVLPLGIPAALPSLGNTTIMLLKDSSIASTITIAELTRAGQLLAISTFKNGTVYLLIALLYLAASLPMAAAVRALERRFARK